MEQKSFKHTLNIPSQKRQQIKHMASEIKKIKHMAFMWM